MSSSTKFLLSIAVLGSAAFFYEVQAAPTEIALHDSNITTIDTLTGLDHSFRVKRQGGGGGCGCGCGCCCRPRVSKEIMKNFVGCGCCGCGGGGRKRRSLDNLRIRLGVKKSAEARNGQPAEHQYPREKRSLYDAMCQTLCLAPAPHLPHPRYGSHDIYGDY
ncbi:unnamed protein product [Cylicocyclus nassatus]|uniref:Uncharacterized protein n=1 Tax=Cylicocyclus nassatus TaxID=53992 RepID=A0AA36H7K0_CYLNA|nr:unnamed protein product [Cylicocyclus nassatus]